MTKKIINFTLYVVLLLIPIVIAPPSIYPDTYNIPKIVLLYFCGATLFICLLINYKELKLDKIDKILLAFIVLVAISTIFSVDLNTSLFGKSNRYEGLLTFLCYFLIYYSGKYFFKFDKKFVIFSLIVIFILSIIAMLQYYNRTQLTKLLMSKYTGRYFSASTFGNRNFFGSFALLAVLYSLCLYLFYNKKTALVVTWFAFFGLLSSLTISVWIGFAVCAFIGIIYLIKKKDKILLKRTLILILILCLSLTHFLTNNPTIFKKKYRGIQKTINQFKYDSNTNLETSESTTSTEKSENSRIVIWKSALKIIKENPILGCGPDAYFKELAKNHTEYLTQEIYPQLKSYPDKAHNEYLQIAATVGIPALIIYLLFLGMILKKLISNKLLENPACFIAFLCLVGYLIQAFFNISTIGVAPIFYFILGYSHQLKKFD